MRDRGMRRLHRARRSAAGELVLHAGLGRAGTPCRHRGGPRARRRTEPAPGGVRRTRGAAVRLLHPRDADERHRPPRGDAGANGRGGTPWAARNALPLHRLPGDRGGGRSGRGSARGPRGMTGRWIGRSLRRPDAHSKLTGELRYASDHSVPGMLVGRVLRSDVARARIHRIDLERARAVRGVTAVIGPNDVGPPIPRFGPLRPDQPVLADGEVRFHGEAIAAVAAVDDAAAREALDAIVVELEDLPAIASLDHAPRAGAGQVLHESRFAWGELPDDAAVAIEREYDGPAAARHVSIEPHACIASWDARGLTVWDGTQHPFAVRRVLAEMFQLPLARVRIVTLPVGGAFGGKGYPKLEPLVALLSRASGQPVGLRASLRESFQLARGAGARVTMRTTVDHDGRLRSQEVQGDFLVGAYADMAPRVVEKSAYLACGPYRTPAARIVGRAIASNTTPSTAFRGFGAPQFTWALESQMEELAGLVGRDPLEFRLQNLCERGELLLPGQTPCDGEWRETLTRAADAVGYGKQRPRGRGVGVAI